MGEEITEFKKGKQSQIEHRIRDGLEQAKNVFFRLDGSMPISDFYKELRKVVNNIRKEKIENAKNRDRAEAIKKNLKGGVVFVSIGDYFNEIRLDSIK